MLQTGLLNALKKGPTAHVAIPPAFPTPKSTFGPPPVRRTTSDAPTSDAPKSVPALPRRLAEPEPEPEEPQGEWADVLYDYTSEVGCVMVLLLMRRAEPFGRMLAIWKFKLARVFSSRLNPLKTGGFSVQLDTRRRLMLCRWTGQIDGQGREGLFPASYVKLL